VRTSVGKSRVLVAEWKGGRILSRRGGGGGEKSTIEKVDSDRFEKKTCA